MPSVLLDWGLVKIYSFGLMAFLGTVFGLFAAWKRAKEYHIEDDQFFDIFLGVGFGGLVLGRISYIGLHFQDFGLNVLKWLWLTHYVGVDFWWAMIGIVVTMYWLVKSSGQDLFRWLDFLCLALCVGLAWGNLGVYFGGAGTYWWVVVIKTALFFGLFGWLWWLEHEYRTIVWYRGPKNSAREGFLWFWFLLWMGVIEAVGALVQQSSTWLVGVVLVVIAIVGLYGRSGRNLKGDWLDLRKAIGLH